MSVLRLVSIKKIKYSGARLFRNHADKKKDFELSEIGIIRIHREREFKKMSMADQKCCTSVQGGGGGSNPFLSCSLISDSCL